MGGWGRLQGGPGWDQIRRFGMLVMVRVEEGRKMDAEEEPKCDGIGLKGGLAARKVSYGWLKGK